jgi:glycosyltransferase involved in cell wall biosynthesis
VLAQDYEPLEYLVIDDGSTDGTRAILESYGDKVAWLTQSNRGQTATINRGWEMTRGKIVAWLNSDDTLLAGAVRTAVQFLEAHPGVDIVFGDTLFTDAAGEPLRRSQPRGAFDYLSFVLECENPIPQPSAFIRRRVIEDAGALDPTLRYFMDWDYWLRAGLRHSIAYLPELLSTYRLHAASNTVARSAAVAPELEQVYDRYFARDDLPAAIRQGRERAMASMHLTSGGYALSGGANALARRCALRAVRTDPASFLRPRRLRQLLYCWLGNGWLYRAGRRLRGRAAHAAPVG